MPKYYVTLEREAFQYITLGPIEAETPAKAEELAEDAGPFGEYEIEDADIEGISDWSPFEIRELE